MACVIVGAGASGVTLALRLQAKNQPFVLINPTDYYHLNFAAVRAVVIPGWAEKTLIPLQPAFGDSFKLGKVVKIIPHESEGRVVLENGEEVAYRYLVIATGANPYWPFKIVGIERDEVLEKYKEIVERVQNAKTVVVIGGGETGIEVCAELKHFNKDREVVLIQRPDILIGEKLKEKGRAQLLSKLKDGFNIDVKLGHEVTNLDRIETTKAGYVETNKELTVQADVVFNCCGYGANTQPYNDGLGDSITSDGTLEVDDHFRVANHTNIFAIGDCCAVGEPKQAFYAIIQAEHLAKSIIKLNSGKASVPYKANSPPIKMAVSVSLGPNDAYARTLSDRYFPAFIVKTFKSKDLFTGKWWKDLKQSVPTTTESAN